ncbi:MAG: GGDEF domain-containing protein [Spirochaetia bacterium]|nr:GGDEF domain-containing protein [Spirochaetia bacterium]
MFNLIKKLSSRAFFDELTSLPNRRYFQLRLKEVFLRYGGEEFAIILPQTSFRGACLIAEKIRKSIETRSFVHNGKIINEDNTASFGVAGFLVHAEYKNDLIECANRALYKVKSLGKNCWAAYDSKN